MKGGVLSNVRDVLYLRGIDMGFIRADVMETFRGKRHYEGLENRLNYIAVMHLEEFHVMTSKPDIKTIDDLQGKVVAFHNQTHVSGLLLLKKLGIKVKKAIKGTMFTGAAKTKSGEYDAIMRITGKPFRGVGRLLKIDPNLRLIPIPYRDALFDSLYIPAKIAHEDYPEFLKEGQEVETVAVNAMLGVYNWQPGTDRHRRLVKFTDAFFSNIDKIKKRPGRHRKWDTISITAEKKGWKRFPAAAEWIRKRSAELAQNRQSRQQVLYGRFKKFIEANPQATGGQKVNTDQMFDKFLDWWQRNRQSGQGN